MTDTPPDWVLLEAAKRTEWGMPTDYIRERYSSLSISFRALCDMIQKYEQPPVDRKLLCAREAMANKSWPDEVEKYRTGVFDCSSEIEQCIRAIELYEQGFGQ